MWTGRKLENDFTTLYTIEVCCDKEKCVVTENKQPVDYVDERIVKSGETEYSRFDMVAVKAVKVTTADRIHVKIMYLSESQRNECLSDILAWIKRYGTTEVIGTAKKAPIFAEI